MTLASSTSSNPDLTLLPGEVDLSAHQKLASVLPIVQHLSEASDPTQVQVIFAEAFRKLHEPVTYLALSTRGLKPGEYRITRYMDPDEPDFDFPPPTLVPWRDRKHLPVHRGGLLGQIVARQQPTIFNDLHADDEPVLDGRLARYRSMLAMPLFDGGQALNWAIQLRARPAAFDPETVHDELLRSNLVGGTVRQVLTLRQLREANERIRQEMERIADIQRALLPRYVPKIPGLCIAASYETYDRAGGDLYDFLPLKEIVDHADVADDPRWAILIGDVSGHGPAAAVVMAMVHAVLHAFPHPPSGPGEMLAHLNRHLVRKRIESSFVTAFLGFYCPKTHHLTYARAGHNPPMVRPRGGEGANRVLDAVGGLPLGILPDQQYDEADLTLDVGETLVLYTDGITEARGGSDAMFGVEGITASLRDCSGEPDCAISHITDALRRHEAGRRPDDDQTLLAIQRIE